MLIVLLSFKINSQMSEVILNLDLFKSYRRACSRRWLFWRSCYCFGKFVWLIFSFKKFWSPVQWTCFLSPLQVLQVQFSLSSPSLSVSESLSLYCCVHLMTFSWMSLIFWVCFFRIDHYSCLHWFIFGLVPSFVSLSVTLSVFSFF